MKIHHPAKFGSHVDAGIILVNVLVDQVIYFNPVIKRSFHFVLFGKSTLASLMTIGIVVFRIYSFHWSERKISILSHKLLFIYKAHGFYVQSITC